MSTMTRSYGLVGSIEIVGAFGDELGAAGRYGFALNAEDAQLVGRAAAAADIGYLGSRLRTRGHWVRGIFGAAELAADGKLEFALDAFEFAWLCEFLLELGDRYGDQPAESLRRDLLSTIGIEEI